MLLIFLFPSVLLSFVLFCLFSSILFFLFPFVLFFFVLFPFVLSCTALFSGAPAFAACGIPPFPTPPPAT